MKSVDLVGELENTRDALAGVKVLLGLLMNHSAPSERVAALVPRASVAMLELVVARLRAVERAASGASDAAGLSADFNTVLAGADGMLVLRPWSEARRQQEAERESQRLKRQRERKRRP
jgi:hypothetical protein